LCIELLENLGYELGKHIAGLMNLFNPEMVIVGGVLSTVDEYLILPIKTAIKKHSLNMVNKDTVVKISALRERAGMIGACMLARSRVFDINSSF
ncbi:MAG: ROK family protein, partial [Muribaculaceae bacterium]